MVAGLKLKVPPPLIRAGALIREKQLHSSAKLDLGADFRRNRRDVTRSLYVLQGPPVRLVVISLRCKVVRDKLAKQFERRLKIFNQMIENKSVDHFVLANTFHVFGHGMMQVSHSQYERRAGI